MGGAGVLRQPRKDGGHPKLAADAQWFEDRMPGRRSTASRESGASPPTPSTSSSRPATPPDHAGRDQPAQRPGHPREVWQQVGVSLERERGCTTSRPPPNFARNSPGRPRKPRARRSGAAWPGELTTDLHEVIGHASGKIAEHLKGSPQSVLRGAVLRAGGIACRFVALYFLPNLRMVELGLIDPADHAEIVQVEVRELCPQCTRPAAPHP